MAQEISGRDALLATESVLVKKPRYKNIVHLWEFLLELLADESCKSMIVWSREAHGEFKLKNQEEVARRWGELKHRSNMNYEKLSRALRHYYSQGIIKKVDGQRLVYKFHKLPYEYTPGKTRSPDGRQRPPAATIKRDQFCTPTQRPLIHSLPGKERVRIKLLKERQNGEEAEIQHEMDYLVQEGHISSSVKAAESATSRLLPTQCYPPVYRPVPVHLPTCCHCQFRALGGPARSHGSQVFLPVPSFVCTPTAAVSVIRRL